VSGAVPATAHADAPDFLRGGALYGLMSRFGVDPEHAARAARRAVLVALLLWVPQALLAAFEGHALPGKVAVPLLLDVAAWVRPWVVVPLLLVAEPILGRAWRQAGERLCERGVVPAEQRAAYDALVARVTRGIRRVLPELVCLALALGVSAALVSAVVAAPRDVWFAVTDADGTTRVTPSGLWYAFAVHGTLAYLSLRWLWRLGLWYRFLVGVARLPLHLFPAHPDRAAGLGFVGRTLPACAPLILGWSTMLACAAANRMLHFGAPLTAFTPLGGGVLAAVLLLFVVPPILVFLPLLARTRRAALDDWGRRLARCSERSGASPADATASDVAVEPLNLEELDVAVRAVRSMRPLPLDLTHLVVPLVAALVPAVGLLFLAIPAGEILDALVHLVV
jgi:hypothetical protein